MCCLIIVRMVGNFRAFGGHPFSRQCKRTHGKRKRTQHAHAEIISECIAEKLVYPIFLGDHEDVLSEGQET